jgi:hypothetical protein
MRLGEHILKPAESERRCIMTKFDCVEEIRDLAIAREEESYAIYRKAARHVKDANIKRIINELAEDELKHKGKLTAVKQGNVELFFENGIELKIDESCEPKLSRKYWALLSQPEKHANSSVPTLLKKAPINIFILSRRMAVSRA